MVDAPLCADHVHFSNTHGCPAVCAITRASSSRHLHVHATRHSARHGPCTCTVTHRFHRDTECSIHWQTLRHWHAYVTAYAGPTQLLLLCSHHLAEVLIWLIDVQTPCMLSFVPCCKLNTKSRHLR